MDAKRDSLMRGYSVAGCRRASLLTVEKRVGMQVTLELVLQGLGWRGP